jgi:hypothetical protein
LIGKLWKWIKNMTSNQAYLNLRESAEYLGMGKSTLKRIWPSLERYGIIPSRFPARTLRFKKTDLDRLMQETKVINREV